MYQAEIALAAKENTIKPENLEELHSFNKHYVAGFWGNGYPMAMSPRTASNSESDDDPEVEGPKLWYHGF